jgi:hypothetical protein
MGLLGTIDPALERTLAEGILTARKTLREQFEGSKEARLVEPFDAAAYNNNATLGENLLFGTPVGEAFDMERLALNPYVLEVLEKSGLIEDMLKMGRSVAETMIEIFADLPPGHEFFEQYSFISSEDLPEYQTTLSRTARQSFEEMREDDRERLLSLPFKLIPARHRLDVLDDAMRARLLEARKVFADGLPEELQGTVEFFDAEKYNAAATLQDNILFGKVIYGQAQAQNKVAEMITETLKALNLTEAVMEAGLNYHVGVALRIAASEDRFRPRDHQAARCAGGERRHHRDGLGGTGDRARDGAVDLQGPCRHLGLAPAVIRRALRQGRGHAGWPRRRAGYVRVAEQGGDRPL